MIAIGESSEVFEFLEGLGWRGARDERDEKSDQVKRVDEQIEQDGRQLRVEGRGRIGGDLDNGDEEVTGIGDGGVSDEAIDIGLEECEEVTGDHSGEAREEEEVIDNGRGVLGLGGEGNDFNEEGKGGGFKGSGHQSGDGHGRALVDIGEPLMEGEGADFKEEGNDKEEESKEEVLL